LISSSVNLTASINGIEAVAKIKIVQKEDEIGPDIKIEIVDKDFVNNRARWADREGKPNLLEISSKHPAVSCYLGPPPYDGQNSPEFEVLEAEIVAESVCMRLLKIETQRSSWLFNWADLKEDEMIADSVLLEYTRRMKIFLPIAHSIIIKH